MILEILLILAILVLLFLSINTNNWYISDWGIPNVNLVLKNKGVKGETP